jgi:hypothetical protein
MQSKARTVREYLAELPPDRRAAIQAVREVILANLDPDYEEGMQYGGIGYYVPHRLFPAGYHCDPSQPLPFAGLGSQKNHMSVGFMAHYGGSAEGKWFRSAWAKTGKKLDMGVCCIRFRKLEDLPLDVIGEAVRRVPAKAFIDFYQKAILTMNKRAAAKAAAKPASKKPAARKTVRKTKTKTKAKAGRA